MTQNETLLLGIDIGTTGTKCAIYDLKGELVAHAYQEYSMIHPQPSWAEQDPHRWWNAVQTNLHNCFEQQGIDSRPELHQRHDAGGRGRRAGVQRHRPP